MLQTKTIADHIILSENLTEDSNSNGSSLTSENDNRSYNDLQKMKEFIHEKYAQFLEKFELSEFINSGGSGVIYKGVFKRERKILAFKFKIADKKKMDKNSEISILQNFTTKIS